MGKKREYLDSIRFHLSFPSPKKKSTKPNVKITGCSPSVMTCWVGKQSVKHMAFLEFRNDISAGVSTLT